MNKTEFDDRIYEILHNGGGIQADLVSGVADEMIALLEKTRFTSEIGNGVIVAWDVCFACKKHYLRCNCGTGPTEPPYVADWRKEWLEEKEKIAKREAARKEEHQRILAARVRTAGGVDQPVHYEAGHFVNDERATQPANVAVDNGLDAALDAVRTQKETNDDDSA